MTVSSYHELFLHMDAFCFFILRFYVPLFYDIWTELVLLSWSAGAVVFPTLFTFICLRSPIPHVPLHPPVMCSPSWLLQVIRSLVPDPMKQEPLLVENVPDPLAGEQVAWINFKHFFSRMQDQNFTLVFLFSAASISKQIEILILGCVAIK